MQAIMDAMGAGKSLTLAEVATALNTAGVKAGEAAVTEADVRVARDALKARPELQQMVGKLPDGTVPIMVALMLAEQVNDTPVPFRITTQDQFNAYISALVGAPVQGPTGAMPMATDMMGSSGGTMASSGGMMSGGAMMGGSGGMMSSGGTAGGDGGSATSGGTTAGGDPASGTDGATTGGDAGSATGGHGSHH